MVVQEAVHFRVYPGSDQGSDALEHPGDAVGRQSTGEVLPVVRDRAPGDGPVVSVGQQRPEQEGGVLGADGAVVDLAQECLHLGQAAEQGQRPEVALLLLGTCLLYTSDAADE